MIEQVKTGENFNESIIERVKTESVSTPTTTDQTSKDTLVKPTEKKTQRTNYLSYSSDDDCVTKSNKENIPPNIEDLNPVIMVEEQSSRLGLVNHQKILNKTENKTSLMELKEGLAPRCIESKGYYEIGPAGNCTTEFSLNISLLEAQKFTCLNLPSIKEPDSMKFYFQYTLI